MEKIIIVDGKEVRMRATAAVPRLYRIKFGRDIIQDMGRLRRTYLKAAGKNPEELTEEERVEIQFQVADLEIFENCAYIMAKHGDPQEVPGSVDQWLDQFKVFSIYAVLPEILELWALNEATAVENKKKFAQAAES